jgi:hypothetical protein
MRSFIHFGTFATLCAAAPVAKRFSDFSPDGVYFPLKNGFPNPDKNGMLQIEKQAFGTLSNAPPPDKISDEGLTNLKLIAFNELFETAFFEELYHNLTNAAPGYDLGYGQEYVLDAIKAIAAQEQLHMLNANNALKRFNQAPIEPCKYQFPAFDFQSAMTIAMYHTGLVMGGLQDMAQEFAKADDDRLVRSLTSSLGNEGEQEGFFRLVKQRRPSELPFLTTSTRDFLFSAVQQFVVPGSCPNIDTIPLNTFKPLAVETKDIEPRTQNLAFSFAQADAPTQNVEDYKRWSLVYINQQNEPVEKPLEHVRVEHGRVLFEAAFPYEEFNMNGLTIAAVTRGDGPFANAPAVAKDTLFGPGIISFN